MHLAILAAVVLAQVPLPVPYPGGAQDDYQSPIVSLIAWDKGGSQDWGAGIPSPTIDCAAVGTSSSASLQCSGATPSFAGPGQVAAGSPWWYRGDAAVRPAIALNGSTDWWDLGDVADPAGSFTLLCEYRPDASSLKMIIAKDGSGGGPFYLGDEFGSRPLLRVFKAGGGSSSISAASAWSLGSHYVAAAAYEYVADGTSKIRMNVNGEAPAEITNAVGPPVNTTSAMRIGARGGGNPFSGAIRRCAFFDGWAASTAQLAQMVATQWGLAADRPAGTVATHARTDSTLCCPFSDAECYWVGPGAPCVHAPSYQGWASGGAVAGGVEVYGVGQNALGYSETFANAVWVKSAGVTAADASASCPMSPLAGTRMSLVTTDGEADQIAQDAATTPGRAVWLARATGDSACGVTFGDATGDGAQSLALTDGPLRYWSGGTGQTGLSVARPVGGCARWCMWLAQATAAVYPVPPRSTPGATAYAGSASTATTLTVPVALTDPARWAIAWTGTHGTWRDVPAHGTWLWGLAPSSSANSFKMFIYDTDLTARIYDAASGFTHRYLTSPFAAGSTHTVVTAPGSVYPDLWFDGVRQTGGVTGGVGTGTMSTLSATLAIGKEPSGTGNEFNGLVSRVAQCRRAEGCR